MNPDITPDIYPRYDHNINYCHEMSPEEQEELFMFVESRKEKAQGQGEVKSFKKKSKKVGHIEPLNCCFLLSHMKNNILTVFVKTVPCDISDSNKIEKKYK